jgi:hypothetical protein
MLAKAASSLPKGEGWLYEPKWDGFRAIVFRDGDELFLQSRDLKPLDRYFPELAEPLRANLPQRCVVDGEIVIAGARCSRARWARRGRPSTSHPPRATARWPRTGSRASRARGSTAWWRSRSPARTSPTSARW